MLCERAELPGNRTEKTKGRSEAAPARRGISAIEHRKIKMSAICRTDGMEKVPFLWYNANVGAVGEYC